MSCEDWPSALSKPAAFAPCKAVVGGCIPHLGAPTAPARAEAQAGFQERA